MKKNNGRISGLHFVPSTFVVRKSYHQPLVTTGADLVPRNHGDQAFGVHKDWL